MTERGRDAGFTKKSLPRMGIVLSCFRDLDGYFPTKPQVFGKINNPHCALTELIEDAVVRYDPADHWGDTPSASLQKKIMLSTNPEGNFPGEYHRKPKKQLLC